MAADCNSIFDALRLVREGTSQVGRRLAALAPAFAPADSRTVADDIVFAADYARLLKFSEKDATSSSDWGDLFGSDVCVPLAVASIEDIGTYQAAIISWFAYLDDSANAARTQRLRDRLGYLYAAAGALARALDELKETLPPEIALRDILRNLIRTQLAPALARLIGYYRGGVSLTLVNAVAPQPPLSILRQEAPSFEDTLAAGLSADWTDGADWNVWLAGIAADTSVYGAPGTIFQQINHCATHNLFRSVFDRFVGAYARAVTEAGTALNDTLENWDRHAPHYALFLAFLQLLDIARQTGNRLTGRHLDFYYRTILGLEEKPAEPGRVHLVAELAKQAQAHVFEEGTLFRAGKDSGGKDAVYAAAGQMVANKASIAELKTLYRHGDETVAGSSLDAGRFFASPVANSGDGEGGPILAADQAWHPFFNKVFIDGALDSIAMPQAEIGFAIASHYFLMAEGPRSIELTLSVSGYGGPLTGVDYKEDIRCYLTTEEGWLEIPASEFAPASAGKFTLALQLSGADPAISPYVAKTHGHAFRTDAPILMVALRQDETHPYAYQTFESVTVSAVDINVVAGALRTLAISNDFGPVDASKPFQPFGALPGAGSSLTIGSREMFQKKLSLAVVALAWQTLPAVFPPDAAMPKVTCEFLGAGQWVSSGMPAVAVDASLFLLYAGLDAAVDDAPDFEPDEAYGTRSIHGFLRLKLDSDFGIAAHRDALIAFLQDPLNGDNPGPPPAAPLAASVTVAYEAATNLDLATAQPDAFAARSGRFFHVAPFGEAEQHPALANGADVSLMPQLAFKREAISQSSEAELYIGIAGLKPPQDVSLLFQVVDGTANPLAEKPIPHLHWSYLAADRWIPFDALAVSDGTGEWLKAGIIRLSVPREATADNTLLSSGLHWIRAAVHENSDAVCRLQLVAAQALEAGFADKGNAPGFGAAPLPAGTVTKLVTPDTAVKSVSQPFASFGGKGAEDSGAFYSRISERLRHKDRAISVWDYERLILEAFPSIYKVKCLSHTRYEPGEGGGVYNELAAGHVTVVAVPQTQGQLQRDLLKPYASLGLLQDIQAFLARRNSCFAKLHVRNPQFEEVRLSFAVRLFDGFDRSQTVKDLREAITRHLSPWAYGGQPPTFRGKIYKSRLVDFIEDQPGVDYLTDMRMFLDVNGVDGTADLDEAEGTLAVSILVSAPAARHAVTIIEPATEVLAGEKCGCAP